MRILATKMLAAKMNDSKILKHPQDLENQRGSAIVIALLVLALLMGFVVLSLSRTTAETQLAANDAAEGRAYSAVEGGLETISREFDLATQNDYNPSPTQVSTIETNARILPQFPGYTFDPHLIRSPGTKRVVLNGGNSLLQGLYALRTSWTIDNTATEDSTGVQVQLKRRFFNNAVPIFQFGAFYDDDLEVNNPPPFVFGGRIHTNSNFFVSAWNGDPSYYTSRISAHRNILTDVARNGDVYSNADDVWIRNGSGTFTRLYNNMGSALNGSGSGTDVCNNPSNGARPTWALPLPVCYTSSSWPANETLFNGNLLANQRELNLPLTSTGNDYNELIKRRKEIGDVYNDKTGTAAAPSIVPVTSAVVDAPITKRERYFDKPGISVSLADSKAKLPGCADSSGNAVSTLCGVRLDGNADGNGLSVTPDIGYDPNTAPMLDAYQTTRLNGNRFRNTDPSTAKVWENQSNELWIKVELVNVDPTTNNLILKDVTRDILSLGVTEAAPRLTNGTTNFEIQDGYYANANSNDSRSIIQLQRFAVRGREILPNWRNNPAKSSYFDYSNWGGDGEWNYVLTNDLAAPPLPTTNCVSGNTSPANPNFADKDVHKKFAKVNNQDGCVVPFPIKMFDEREGLLNEDYIFCLGYQFNSPGFCYNIYPNGVMPLAGVMSVVQIDVANLKRLLDGNFDSFMPTTTPYAAANGQLRASSIPKTNNGWVLSLSDRRGDRDFDGEYDMEDIYGLGLPNGNNGILDPGEDLNRNGTLQADYNGLANDEAVKYSVTDTPDALAALDHKYYRRAFKLINGSRLPGKYDAVTPGNTLGFTVASENGIYVQGNYNASYVTGHNANPSEFQPFDTADHVPASVVGDAVTVLSNNWKDANSFTNFFRLANRTRTATETTYRFATIAGKNISHLKGTQNAGGYYAGSDGGLINLIRYAEYWYNVPMNYTGSMISLYNSRVSNGSAKCCSYSIYYPPNRNYSFDTSFLDPDRLPPGTPALQYVQLTGYERVNN